MKKLTPTQYWLKEHQITAFWHTFGISNGLDFLPEDMIEVHYKKGNPRMVYRIKPEKMQKLLTEYVKWLGSYKEVWDTDIYNDDSSPQNESEFLEREKQHERRKDILKMIELLQD